MDFSRAECADTAAIGKSTSISRLQSLGTMDFVEANPHQLGVAN
jgi:hypothetical protein